MRRLTKTQENALFMAGVFAGSLIASYGLRVKKKRDSERREQQLKAKIINAHLDEVIDMFAVQLIARIKEENKRINDEKFNEIVEDF
jgi:hypothetical protein